MWNVTRHTLRKRLILSGCDGATPFGDARRRRLSWAGRSFGARFTGGLDRPHGSAVMRTGSNSLANRPCDSLCGRWSPWTPRGSDDMAVVRAVEAVHDGFARQAVDAAAIEDIANVAKQDDGGIFILLLAGNKDGGLSGPHGQSRRTHPQWR